MEEVETHTAFLDAEGFGVLDCATTSLQPLLLEVSKMQRPYVPSYKATPKHSFQTVIWWKILQLW